MRSKLFLVNIQLMMDVHWMVIARTPRHSIDLSSKLINSTHAQPGINLRQYLFAKDEEEKNPLKHNK
jgi:hypothetical protein